MKIGSIDSLNRQNINHYQHTVDIIEKCQKIIDSSIDEIYGVNSTNLEVLSQDLIDDQESTNIQNQNSMYVQNGSVIDLTKQLLSYLVGSAFGRWNVYYATQNNEFPEHFDPFAPSQLHLKTYKMAILLGLIGLVLW